MSNPDNQSDTQSSNHDTIVSLQQHLQQQSKNNFTNEEIELLSKKIKIEQYFYWLQNIKEKTVINNNNGNMSSSDILRPMSNGSKYRSSTMMTTKSRKNTASMSVVLLDGKRKLPMDMFRHSTFKGNNSHDIIDVLTNQFVSSIDYSMIILKVIRSFD